MNPLPSTLLVVTDRHQAVTLLPDRIATLLDAGLRWIWLRDRDLEAEERRDLAGTLLRLTRAAGATLCVGADVELAAVLEADGVHLRTAGEVSMARRKLGVAALIGVSAHGLKDVRAARDAGADYATLSPLFASASKPGYGPALGLGALSEAARFGLPIVGLGGVTASMAPACLEAGAAAVALMGPAMREGAAGLACLVDLTRRS